jgi:very-short-patch-repair endonuclease
MTTEQRQFARDLRKAPTGAEDTLLQALRGRRFMNLKFRRQVPLLSYTIDFICLELRLALEIDGTHHDRQREYDRRRTKEIETQSFQLLRFSNDQVADDLQSVLDAGADVVNLVWHSP